MPQYITAAQFLKAYDTRRVRDLLSDSGTPVAANDVATDPNLLQILAEASEEVAAAALVSKRYTTAQLTAMAASSTSGFLLRRLTADLAFSLLVARRGQGAADIERLCPRHREAQRQLEQLRLGVALFPLIDDTHAEAGLPDTVNVDALTNPDRIDKLTAKASRLFPADCSRTRTGRCGC